MAYSYVSYTPEVNQTQFIIPFPYLAKEHVKVKVNNVENVSFSWLSDTQLQLLDVTLNDVVYIYRETNPNARLVDFVLPGQLTEEDLDTAFLQGHYLAQEAIDETSRTIQLDADNLFDVRGFQLKNIGQPTSSGDVVTREYADGVRADSETRHLDIVEKHSEVVIKTSDVTQIRDELYNLTTHMTSLPYGSTGSVNYNANTGELTFSLSEGPQGPVGATGPAGETGPQGPDGPQGVIGPEGPIGPQGPIGITGATGLQGVTGLQGPRGETGDVGPMGLQGVIGDQGPQGIAGDTGPQGPVGEAGVMGPTGSQGVQGEKGDTGEQGPMGSQGPIGATGQEGPIGPTGPIGPQGQQGIQGALGDKGPTGDQGPLGPQGSVGDQGPMGSTALGLAFGRFNIDSTTGELQVEFYGDADDQDFSINSNGELEVTF